MLGILRVTLACGVFANAGCKEMMGILQKLGTGTGAGFSPSGLTSGSGILGGLLGLGRSGGTASPGASLPPPGGNTSISQIQRQYGIQVTGDCARGESLSNFAAVMGRMTPGRFQGLTEARFPCSPPQSKKGTWSSNGLSQRVTFYVTPSRHVARHTVSHELCHHLTLAGENRDFGNQMRALPGSSSANCPSSYCHKDDREQLAEICSFTFDEMTGGSDAPKRAGWSPPPDVSNLVRTVM